MAPTRVLEITTNIGCRLRCSYCPQSAVVRAFWETASVGRAEVPRTHTMTRESFAAFISTVPPVVHIHFSGFSEPWHAADCVAMIRLAHETGHQVAVFTTADQMTSQEVAQLVDIPFKRFSVHLPDKGGEMRKRVDASYVSVLRQLASSGIQNLDFFTIGTPNVSIAAELGAVPFTRRVHSRAGNVAISSSEVGAAFTASEISARNTDSTLVCRTDRIFANVLLPNGDVHLCSMDYSLQHKIGNLGEQTYQQIVSGSGFHRILDLLNEPNSDVLCRRCEYGLPGKYHRKTAEAR